MNLQKMCQWAAALLLLGSVPARVFALTAEQLLDQAAPSVVAVQVKGSHSGEQYTGTGVVIRPQQVVISCSLVAGRVAHEIVSSGRHYPATLLFADADKELCVLAAAGLQAPPEQRGSTADLT